MIETIEDVPKLIRGGSFRDKRGNMRFVNSASLEKFKRFYLIKNNKSSPVRAWQGHQFESKMFFPVQGQFLISWVKLDDYKNPSLDLEADYHILDANQSECLVIPSGYANGLKALNTDSEILVFSDKNLEEALNDNYKFPADRWLNWNSF